MLKHMLIGFYIIFCSISMFHRIFHDHPAIGGQVCGGQRDLYRRLLQEGAGRLAGLRTEDAPQFLPGWLEEKTIENL